MPDNNITVDPVGGSVRNSPPKTLDATNKAIVDYHNNSSTESYDDMVPKKEDVPSYKDKTD